jgi:hypothetical protein
LLDYAFEASTVPTTYYLALCTSATSPTKATNLFSELTQVAIGQGYTTGGNALTAATDFTVTEVDSTVGAKVVLSDQTWTASGGNLPASGDGARWAVLLDGSVSGSNVLAYFDLVSDRTVSDTQTLTIQAAEIDANEP